MTDPTEVEELLGRLDGSSSRREWEAVARLRQLGSEFPSLLLRRFRSSGGWEARASCVFHAIRYARVSEDAVILGREAIRDRSRKVRYRGCMLLAYSLREDVLEALNAAAAALAGKAAAEDLRAAIDAIECRNFNYFLDRKHTGKVKIEISDELLSKVLGPPIDRES